MSKRKKTDIDLDNIDLDAEMAAFEADLSRSLNPVADPMADVEYTGNPEIDSQADLTALQKAFRERKQAEARRFELATDSEYWVALCFQTRDQKEAFLRALDLIAHGDKYLDGAMLAKKMGVALPQERPPYNISGKIDRKLANLAGGY